MNKKILFLITESDFGGAQKFLLEFIPFLATHKSNFNIVIAAGGAGLIFNELEKQRMHVLHIKNLSAKHFTPFQDTRAFFDIYALLKKQTPDMLFCMSTKAGFYGSWASIMYKITARKKLKILYRIGGFAFMEKLNWFQKTLYLWIEKLTAWAKDIIIVNSQHDFGLALSKKIVPRHKLKLIRNGINLNSFKQKLLSRNEALKRLSIQDTHKLIIGTIANFYRNKGLSILVDAAHDLIQNNPKLKENILFIVIGDGPEKKVIEEKLNRYKLNNIFLLKGAIAHAASYLKAFDIFVLPSLKEGSPWTILEAMAAESAIIATLVGGVPELIENKKSGLLIQPSNKTALQQTLRLLLEDKDYREYLSKETAQKAEAFSLETMLQQYLNIIKEVLR